MMGILDALKGIGTRQTPQSAILGPARSRTAQWLRPGRDRCCRLDRFLILGSEGGSYWRRACADAGERRGRARAIESDQDASSRCPRRPGSP
jgi:hypothetical protein